MLARSCSVVALAAGLLLTFVLPGSAQTLRVDVKLPDYRPVQGVSGNIKSVGSDTMNNLMTLWAEGFIKYYPNVRVEIEGKGSSTAPPALVAGTANFGPMSREMKSQELDAFEARYGYKPTALPTGIDMLAVFVNKDNPIESLTLPQVDAVFGKNRNLGAAKDMRTWGDLGLTGTWAALPISLYGRNSASGTYGYFKEFAIGKGDFKDSVKEQPGSSSVVQAVARERAAIGYSGIGYTTADVKAIALATDGDSKPVAPVAENAYSGDYPLARFLLVYINHKPGSQLDPLNREFVKYIFSKQGQEVVLKDQYFPVTADVAQQVLAELGIKQ